MAGDTVFDQREKTPAGRVPSYESMTLQEPPAQESPRQRLAESMLVIHK